jgi:tetratricopeptide (TPR) repeat protein
VAPLLERAQHLIDLRRYDEADRLIDRALAEDPESAWAHVLRARIRTALGDWSGTRESARAAAALRPEWAHVHATLSVAVLNDDDYVPDSRLTDWLKLRSGDSLRLAEALYHADRALELSPEIAYFHGIRARVLLAHNRLQAALAATDAGLAIDPSDPTCRIARHDVLVYAGREEDAARFTTESLRADPNHEVCHERLGELALERGDYPAAFAHARTALRADPDYRAAQSIYWDAAAHLGPGVGTLARVRTAFLRLLRWPIRIFVASPGVTFFAVIITTLALILLAISSLRHGDMLVGWAAIALLLIPAVALAVPVTLWAALHLLLIVRRRDRRAVIPWSAWLTTAAVAAWVIAYCAACYTVTQRARPPYFVPPLLALSPLVALALAAASETRTARALLSAVGVANLVFAISALLGVRSGVRDAGLRFLLLAGLLTLLADVLIPRLDRRLSRPRSRRPAGPASHGAA